MRERERERQRQRVCVCARVCAYHREGMPVSEYVCIVHVEVKKELSSKSFGGFDMESRQCQCGLRISN